MTTARRLTLSLLLGSAAFVAHASASQDALHEQCAEDPLACQTAVRELIAAGVVDRDRDGVADFADACPGTPTEFARADRWLRDQDLVFARVHQIFHEAALAAIESANSTLGTGERRAISHRIRALEPELLDLANGRSDGGYLFDGLRDAGPPFAISQPPHPPDPNWYPMVEYSGGSDVLRVPPGPLNRGFPFSIPGDIAFLGAGPYPEPGVGGFAFDLFELLDNAEAGVQTDVGARAILSQLHAALDIIEFVRSDYQRVHRRVARIVVTPESAGVDASGCSQRQFCEAIDASHTRGIWRCFRSDYENDEPLRTFPWDCWVYRDAGGARCGAIPRPATSDRSVDPKR